ncbi:hypothetical protein [Apibacter sp. HY039]|uniref:hypothetical protein n=1 Tax=Apibacter sp. HY039 TaxID=2501476 RepID=UPI000FEC0A6E|nr:hypothetical protein [Apibacter sp. HY039]
MIKQCFILILFICALVKAQAQSQGVALNVGYSYINTNAGYLGGEYAYRFDPENWHGIALGAGTLLGSFNGDFKFVPEAHVTYSNTLFLGEFSITPHNINPSLGINGMNIFRLKIGYSWEIGNDKIGMKGITFGINYLLGSKGFKDQFELKH